MLCKPRFSISTPALFRAWDRGKRRLRPDTKGILLALEAGDLVEVARRMFNVFEGVLPSTQQREIESIKTALLTAGALGAAMSGSGPTVFGLFREKALARSAVALLREDYEEVLPNGTSRRPPPRSAGNPGINTKNTVHTFCTDPCT